MSKPTLLLLLLSALPIQASPTEAERIKRGHALAAETWGLRWQIASDPLEKKKLLETRPDTSATATELWRQIAPSLKEAWTIPYAAYFLSITGGTTGPAFTEERKRILETFSQHHTTKPGIAPFCIAVAENGDVKNLPLLEKITAENPEEATKGIAALSSSMLLKTLGDAPELMKKRLTYLRQAIIMAADQTVGEISVADIVTEELYLIRFLSKGRLAPDLSGTDVGGRTIKLSEMRGKTVILLFWDATSPETDRLITITNQMAVKYADKPVAILGITPEALGRIRELQADGSIKWNNLIDPTDKLAQEYRIGTRPAAFVISPAGKLEYIGSPGSFVELTVDAMLADPAPRQ